MGRKFIIPMLLIIIALIIPAIVESEENCSVCSGKKIDNILHVSLTADGNLIAAGSPESGIICLLDKDGNVLWSYGTGNNITGISISDDGNYIAATTFCGDLYFFSGKGDLLWQKVILGCNNRVELSGDGQTGYVFADSTTNGMLNGEYYERRPQNVCHFDRNGTIYWHKNIPAFDSSISSDGKYFVSNSIGNGHSLVSLYSDDGTRLWEYQAYMYVMGISISEDADTIAANVRRTPLVVLDINGDILWQIKPKYMMESVAVSPDGNFIAAGTQYKLLYYNRAGDLLWEYDTDDYIRDIAISEDGRYLAGKYQDDVCFFDGFGELLWKRPVEDGIGSLTISGIGMTVAVGTENNSVCLFDNSGNSTVIYLDDIPVNPLPDPVCESGSVCPPPTESASLSFLPVFVALFILGFLFRK